MRMPLQLVLTVTEEGRRRRRRRRRRWWWWRRGRRRRRRWWWRRGRRRRRRRGAARELKQEMTKSDISVSTERKCDKKTMPEQRKRNTN
jgi:hypothetical protein